jgi:hypothetical protein
MTTTTIGQRFEAGRPVVRAARAIRPRSGVRRLWQVAALTTLTATGGSVLAYELARALGVTFLMSPMPGSTPSPLPVGMVALMSALGALAGTVAFGLLGRFAARRPWLFTVTGVAFLLLSFAGPLTVEGADTATRIALMTLHVIAGGSTIALLNRLGRHTT